MICIQIYIYIYKLFKHAGLIPNASVPCVEPKVTFLLNTKRVLTAAFSYCATFDPDKFQNTVITFRMNILLLTTLFFTRLSGWRKNGPAYLAPFILRSLSLEF